MTEYHTVKRIDNSRLLRPAPVARLNPLWQRVAAGSAMAGCLFFYAWQHFECIQLRYQIQAIEGSRVKSAQLNRELHEQVAELHNPARIAHFAAQIGLTVSTPGQVAPSDGQYDAVVAQARAVMQPRP
jgi:hypothetical protein